MKEYVVFIYSNFNGNTKTFQVTNYTKKDAAYDILQQLDFDPPDSGDLKIYESHALNNDHALAVHEIIHPS